MPIYQVYETTNTLNGKKYVGVHINNYFKGYLGSGVALKSAVNQYGKENFTKKILYTFDSAEEAYEKESQIVDDDWVLDRNNYNLCKGGIGGNIGGNNALNVLNIETLEIYPSVVIAAKDYGMNRRTLQAQLDGQNPNKTNLMLIRKEVRFAS